MLDLKFGLSEGEFVAVARKETLAIDAHATWQGFDGFQLKWH